MINIIIYGTGNDFNRIWYNKSKKKKIHTKYNVVGFVDKNANYPRNVSIENCKQNIKDFSGITYDRIMVTSSKFYEEIRNELISEGVDEKIIFPSEIVKEYLKKKKIREIINSRKSLIWISDAIKRVYFKAIEVKMMLENILKDALVKKYPTVIQLPITYKCNFNCVMCGMNKHAKNRDFTIEELNQILKNKLFKRIKSVGVNGGELFIRNDLVDVFKTLINDLPSLKSFSVISNGFYTDTILSELIMIHNICKKNNIELNFAVSIDGIGDIQDQHRGHKDAFRNAENTINKILKNKSTYVDSLSIICTISALNIEYIEEMEAWIKQYNIPITYNIATPNVRIDNFEKIPIFSVFNDNHKRMLTQEFFYKQYKITGDERYYGLYLYARYGERFCTCPCRYNSWVTLTPDGEISYCAVHSKNLGSALNESAYDIFNKNHKELYRIKKEDCKTCAQYSYTLNSRGLKILHKEMLENDYMRP